jgi:hypothetical protein
MSVNKDFANFLGNSSVFVIITVVVALVVLPSMSTSTDVDAKPIDVKPLEVTEETLERFKEEFQKVVEAEESVTLDALAEQDLILEEILDGINKLLPAPGLGSVEVEEPAKQPNTSVKLEPIRMSSTTWNVKGDWNFTEDELRRHIESDHDLENLTDYSLEELKVIHDNMHNGYTPFGSSVQTKKPPIKVKSLRSRLFSRNRNL